MGDGDIVLIHLAQVDVKPQPSLHVAADIPQLLLRLHELLILIVDTLREPVAVLILQEELVLAPVDRYHADTVCHRIGTLPVHFFMDDDDILHLRIVDIDSVHEEQRRKSIGSLIRDHLRSQHMFVQICKVFINMPQFDLIHHKPLDRDAVTLFQIRIPVPVLDDIRIQESIQLILQTALIRKIHQHHLGDLYALLDIAIFVKLERHHIIFIEPRHPHGMLHPERIPRIVLHTLLIPHDQNVADGCHCLRGSVGAVHLPQYPEQQHRIFFLACGKVLQLLDQLRPEHLPPGSMPHDILLKALQLQQEGRMLLQQQERFAEQQRARAAILEQLLHILPAELPAALQVLVELKDKPAKPPFCRIVGIDRLDLIADVPHIILRTVDQRCQIQIIAVLKNISRLLGQSLFQHIQVPLRLVEPLLCDQQLYPVQIKEETVLVNLQKNFQFLLKAADPLRLCQSVQPHVHIPAHQIAQRLSLFPVVRPPLRFLLYQYVKRDRVLIARIRKNDRTAVHAVM